jgi:hypothetical protein
LSTRSSSPATRPSELDVKATNRPSVLTDERVAKL